ncbi:MAG: Ppx/GppA phosphatase family protein [Leptolyngbyaceae bacterium]|nr:Ppx/GppA phosphatase family protein [Leptolyngbyaceae bacterium]
MNVLTPENQQPSPQAYPMNSSPESPKHSRTMAAIDVGTNSIHLVVAQIDPSLPAFNIVAREKDTVRLGERDPDTGCLTPKAMKRAMNALKRCQDLAKSLDAEEIIAVATSAVREAPNGQIFLDAVKDEIDLTVDLISGEEEARRIYLGVLSGMEFDQHPHIIIDIGGGSTELILGDGRHDPRSLSSTKVGAVRLTNEFITTDPIDDMEFTKLQAYIWGMLERSTDELMAKFEPGERPKLVGTSGTIETLATIYAYETFGSVPMTLNGVTMSLSELRRIVERLRLSDRAERMDIPGMSEKRADIILAGALILQEAMTMLNAESIMVCERALREGVVVNWMLSNGFISDSLRYQSSVRERSVHNLAKKYQVNVEHSQRVGEFAQQVFNQTRGVLHSWGDRERELLWAGAMLHNCGHFVNHAAHHKHSYYLIRNGGLLGYTEAEIEMIANLARYHRKSQPKKKHDNYRALPSKECRGVVDQLGAMLRVAVALDRRQIGAIASIQCQYDDSAKELRLFIYPSHTSSDCDLELWSLSYKKTWFEEEFDLTLVPKIVVKGADPRSVS